MPIRTPVQRPEFLSRLEPAERKIAERAFVQQGETKRRAAARRDRAVRNAVDGTNKRLLKLLGAKKYRLLRESLRGERIAFRDFLEPPIVPDRDVAKADLQRRRRADALLKRLGSSPDELRQIGGSADAQVRKVLSASTRGAQKGFRLSRNLDSWHSLSPLHTVSLPWGDLQFESDPNDPHRFFLFRPPYAFFQFDFESLRTGNFVVDHTLFLDPSIGVVGNQITMDNGDADDTDVAHGIAESQVVVMFEPPVTGVIEVLIDAVSTVAENNVGFEDEWGWSNAWAGQNNFLMMNVLHPNVSQPSEAQMIGFFGESDGDNVGLGQRPLARGQHFFARLFSAGVVPAGRRVAITAGTRSFDIAFTNDMEVHSRSNVQWFISSIEVRVAP